MRHTYRAYHAGGANEELPTESHPSSIKNKEINISTRILIWSLITSFVICWTPFHLYHIAVSFGKFYFFDFRLKLN